MSAYTDAAQSVVDNSLRLADFVDYSKLTFLPLNSAAQENLRGFMVRVTDQANAFLQSLVDGGSIRGIYQTYADFIDAPLAGLDDGYYRILEDEDYAADNSLDFDPTTTRVVAAGVESEAPVIDPGDAVKVDLSESNGTAMVGHRTNVNLQKWLNAGEVHAGMPADAIFTTLQDAIDEGITRQAGVVFTGVWTVTAPVEIYAGTSLRGHSRKFSVIKIGNAAECKALILNPTEVTGEYITLRDIQFNGNRTTQTTDPGPLVDIANTDSSGEPRISLSTLYVRDAKGDGFRLKDYFRDGKVYDLTSYNCDGIGIIIAAADCQWSMLNSGQAGGAGIQVNRPASISSSKAWRAGRLIAANGNGFELTTSFIQLAACWSQDCANDGLQLVGNSTTAVEGCNAQFVSDSCDRYGVRLSDYVNGNNVNITVRDRGGTAPYGHSRAVSFSATNVDANEVVVNNASYATLFTLDATNPNVGTNNFHISNRAKFRVITYAATQVINAQQRDVVSITLTGSQTISSISNGWTGAEIELQWKQDATGGRNVTLPANAKTNAAWVPDTAANKTNTLRLRYDGTNWLQVSCSIGIAA